MSTPPKRYKKTSFVLCLLIGLLYLGFGLYRVTAPNIYEQDGWFLSLLISAVFLTAAILLHRRNRASERAWAEIERERVETDRLLREKLQAEQDERKARKAEWERTHGRIRTKLAGVTFDNEDGSSRQRALQSAMADDCSGSVALELYDYKGKNAIRVEYEGTVVGNIPQDRVAEVAAVLDRISAASLSVSRFVPEDEDDETRGIGGVIYRADLELVYTKS